MDPASLGILVLVGFASGFLAGFLGIGGGVIVIPALVYMAAIPIKLATGISVVEAFCATVSGAVAHRRNRTVHVQLGLAIGLSGALGAFLGALGSASISSRALLVLYLFVVVVALLLLLFARREEKSQIVEFNLWTAIPAGFGVGLVAGMLGVGGGFLLMPLMITLLRIPTKVAVGTTLLVVILTTFTGATGKIASGQFDPQIGIPVVIAAVVGAQLGGKLNSRVPSRAIRMTLALILTVIVIRTAIDLLAGQPPAPIHG